MKKRIKVGIIGCGTIGSEIARACLGILRDKVILTAIYDVDKKKVRVFEKKAKKRLETNSIEQLIKKSDIIVEAASSSVSARVLKKAIRNKKDVMIMSVGGLVGFENLLAEAEKRGTNVYLPSGAISGIDALKAARISKIRQVTLITRKPPEGLIDAPYLKEHNINLKGIKKEKIVFEGNALEAVKGFPKNINVSALLSLAGIGPRRTRVKIVADPKNRKNIHQVEIKGDFGVIKTETINVPSRPNLKTSALAIFSAIATLKGALDSVRIGT